MWLQSCVSLLLITGTSTFGNSNFLLIFFKLMFANVIMFFFSICKNLYITFYSFVSSKHVQKKIERNIDHFRLNISKFTKHITLVIKFTESVFNSLSNIITSIFNASTRYNVYMLYRVLFYQHQLFSCSKVLYFARLGSYLNHI